MREFEGKSFFELNEAGGLLVPADFTPDVGEEMSFAANSFYPHYPTPVERLHMTEFEIDEWMENGERTADLPAGNYSVMSHPNYLRGLEKGRALFDDGTIDFSSHHFIPSAHPGGYKRDERGLPIRPNDEIFLQKGAIEGIGFYRTYGPNLTADPVVFRQKDEKLQVLVIERQDSGLIALPGGMQDPNEPGVSTATRELFEEANIDLRDTPTTIIHMGIVWSDTRSTRHAWPETMVVLLLPDASRTDEMKPKAGDDAKEARWLDTSEENLQTIFPSHAGFIKMAALSWQQQTGHVVSRNGQIQ